MKDEELVNEMLKPIAKDEIRAGYPILTEDHFFFQQVVDFMQDKRIWLGAGSDLIYDMNCKTVSANTAAKLLHKYGKTMLKKKGVSVKFIRTNRKRLIELKK
ncbi:MAG: hypothetical protein IJN12_01050 [Clostridia bacterium]|nr:hypothetical protein [Clostridia bacterium]